MPIEMQFILVITIVLAVGLTGGIILAYAFELDSYARHRRNLRANRKARRQARREADEKRRKNVNFTIDFF